MDGRARGREAKRMHQANSGHDAAHRLKALSGRDLQLWSLGLMVMMVLASALFSFVLPNTAANLKLEARYLPQLALGLIALVLLLNLYLIEQRREIDRTRQTLVAQVATQETTARLEIIDPVAHVFNRRYMDELLARELRDANRAGQPITLLLARHTRFDLLLARFGRSVAEQFVADVARLLQRNFRGSDGIVRYSDSEFLVVMPATDEQKALFAFHRLQQMVDAWNIESNSGCEMVLRLAYREYQCGMDAWSLVAAMERELQRASSPLPSAASRPAAEPQLSSL
jgi:diguanylate cyclase (GGDEF)-like protein